MSRRPLGRPHPVPIHASREARCLSSVSSSLVAPPSPRPPTVNNNNVANDTKSSFVLRPLACFPKVWRLSDTRVSFDVHQRAHDATACNTNILPLMSLFVRPGEVLSSHYVLMAEYCSSTHHFPLTPQPGHSRSGDSSNFCLLLSHPTKIRPPLCLSIRAFHTLFAREPCTHEAVRG